MHDSKNLSASEKVLTRSPLVLKLGKKRSPSFNLACAVLHRISSSVKFLNTHDNFPASGVEFIHFLVHCSVLKESIRFLYANSGLDYNALLGSGASLYFKDICQNQQLEVQNDDEFFCYLRALVFAHPYETNSRRRSSAKEYSPFPYADRIQQEVGAIIYQEGLGKIITLGVPFASLLGYIKTRYQLLKPLYQFFMEIVNHKYKEWKGQKIVMRETPVETLQDIQRILKNRYVQVGEIDELIDYLTLDLTEPQNYTVVQELRKGITSIIPIICQAVEDMDYNLLFDSISEVVGWKAVPKIEYHEACYDLEKIFCLDAIQYPTDILSGRMSARSFYEHFAKKWVFMDVDSMSINEIKLLTVAACYYEKRMKKG